MSFKFLPIDSCDYINIYFIKEIYYDNDDEILYFSIFNEDDYAFELMDLYNDDDLSKNILSILNYLGLYKLVSDLELALTYIDLDNK